MLNDVEAFVGSVCNIWEDETEVHTLSLSGDVQATEKLKLEGSFTYNYSSATGDWDFSERESLGEVVIRAPNDVNTGTAYDTWKQNNLIAGYSDLEYTQYSFTLGGTYNFTDAFYTKMQGTYDIFESDEEYVYGDEDGKAYSGYLAIGYKF